MIIARFGTLQGATDKMGQYNILAQSPDPDFNLAPIHKHTTQELWWFNFSECVKNGGLGREAIEADVVNLDTIVVESVADLIAMGYLPEPTPP